LKDVIFDIFKYNNDPISPDQVHLFVEKVFESADGNGEAIYRVQLKKAILQNLKSLKMMQLDQLRPQEQPMINLILSKLDESKSGLIPKRELKQVIKQVSEENGLSIEDTKLNDLADSLFIKPDGSRIGKMTR
jgi:hypothetical protein